MLTSDNDEPRQHEATVNSDDPSSPFYAPKSPSGISLCRGCRRLHRCRFGIESEHIDQDGGVVSRLLCPREDEGGPDVAHGGWTASVMDELAGHTLTIIGEFAVTGTLTVKFKRPVPIGVPLLGRASIVRREGRRVFVEASLELEASGAALASAEAIMVKRPATHFDSHQEWLRSQTERR